MIVLWFATVCWVSRDQLSIINMYNLRCFVVTNLIIKFPRQIDPTWLKKTNFLEVVYNSVQRILTSPLTILTYL